MPGELPRSRAMAWSAAALVLAIALLAGLWWWRAHARTPTRVRLATSTQYISAGVFLAELRGDFAARDLDLELQVYASGKEALAAVIAGRADLATVAQTPLMHAIVAGEPLAIWASLGEARGAQRIIVRADRGITTARDLRGRTIALPRGTSAEIYALNYLKYHGVDPGTVTFVGRSPVAAEHDIIVGAVDAVCLWDPYAIRIQEALPGSIALHEEAIFEFNWNLVSRPQVPANEVVVPVLRALREAYTHLDDLDAERIAILASRFQTPPAELQRALDSYRFRIELDVGLANILEIEAEHLYGPSARSRAFADAIHSSPLRLVDPTSVAVPW